MKLSNKELPPHDSFFNILRNINPLEKDYNDFEKLVQGGLCREQALAKIRMKNVVPTRAENHAFFRLSGITSICNLLHFFLKQCNSENFVPTLKLMQKVIEL